MTWSQWALAYQPWRSDEDSKAYDDLPEDWLEHEPLMPLLQQIYPEIAQTKEFKELSSK